MSSRTVSVALQAKVDLFLAALAAGPKGTDDGAIAGQTAGKERDGAT